MEDEIPLLKESSSVSDVEVLQEVSLTPLETLPVPFSNSENAAAFVPSVTESVSFKTETNQNAGPSILQSTTSAVKGKDDADSTMAQSTSPSIEPNQDATPSHLSTAKTNQDAVPATASAVLSIQVVGPSTSSAVLPNQVIDPLTSSVISPNQVIGPSTSLSIRNAGRSLSSSTESSKTNELMLSGQYIRRTFNHEGASTHQDAQPTENDPLLPKDPPYYHDIIPIFESGSHIPSPPPTVFKSLFCCFFGEYYLYYSRKIRNSRLILIPLVAFLALPLSALCMGFKYYFSSCSGSLRTPLLLCIAGGVGLLLNSLRIVTIMSRRFENLGMCEPPRILVESSALFLFCLFIVEFIEFFLNGAVFDDPSHPLYCPESLHDYIFYVNFVVLAIGICALLIHLPTTPMNKLQRYVEEASAAVTLRQQQPIDHTIDDPSLPQYTAWTKPRRRRSGHHRSRVYAHNDSRGRYDEEGIEISYTTSEETTVAGETVEGRDVRVHWLDQANAASGYTTRDEEYTAQRPMGNQSAVSWQRFLQEANIVVTVDNRRRQEGAVGRSIEVGAVGGDIEDGAVGEDIEDGAVGEDIEDGAVGGDIKADTTWGPMKGRMWNQSAVGGQNIGGDAVGGDFEDSTESGENRALQWEEGESLDTPLRNRSSTYTIHHGEENPARDLSGPSSWDEEDRLRSQRLEERSNYLARPKTRETMEGGTRPKRDERSPDHLQTEMTETEVLNESRAESEDLGTNWHEYGARPKTKVKPECISKITIDSVRRNESTEAGDVTFPNKEVAEIDAFGDQGNEGGAQSKVIVDAERGAQPKQKGNTDDKRKEGDEADTGDKVEEHSGVKVEDVTEGGDLPKCEESIETDVTSQISECTQSNDSEKIKKETEDDDTLE